MHDVLLFVILAGLTAAMLTAVYGCDAGGTTTSERTANASRDVVTSVSPEADKTDGSASNPQPRPAPQSVSPSTQPAALPQIDVAAKAAGLALYAQHCGVCHGEKGTGDGIAAYLLYPKPRDFSQGAFRITSTKTGLPTDEDLIRVLRRGMPGSAMPSWNHLSDTDLQALVIAVRSLATDGRVENLLAKNKSMKGEKAREIATNVMTPGPVVELPPRAADGSDVDLERGKVLFAERCAACHDLDGRGRNKRDLRDISGDLVFARDFTQGIFKGGSETEEIARRIVVGMPGSPMPAADMPPKDLWSLVEHVRAMVKPGAQERSEQVMLSLRAHRVESVSGLSAGSADAWAGIEPTFVPLMPLWWRDDRVEGVNARAVHDGTQVAIELSWEDATEDDLPNRPQSFSDGAAIQLAADPNPPLFAMGAAGSPVTIWYWKASRQRDLADGEANLNATYPNAVSETYEPWIESDDIFNTARAVRNPVAPGVIQSAVEELRAGGIGTLTAMLGVSIRAAGTGSRTDTGWRVTFVYPLSADGAADPSTATLAPGASSSIALAVWEGSAGDRNGQKSVTIWHRLVLDP